MSTDFGKVSSYVDQKGFGFVRGLLIGNGAELFFHIRTLKRTNPQLASTLVQNPFHDIFFWFDIEKTPKGNQVRSVLTPERMQSGDVSDPAILIAKIESLWRKPGYAKPPWLEDATVDLLGHSRMSELALERRSMEDQIQKERQAALKASEARLDAIKEQRRVQTAAKRAQDDLEQQEFGLLVSEIRKMGFSHSSQVSSYIVSKRLGMKYRNISGILQMELNGTT